MSIVYQKDKRSGITYAYESQAWWDKEKKQSRSRRTLIGRLDEESGKVVPTDGRGRKKSKPPASDSGEKAKPELIPFVITAHSYYGATYFLDAIGNKLGITQNLKHCFPETWDQILSVAYYLIMEENNPLSRFEKWGRIHKHPYGKNISPQDGNELFASITNESRRCFFRLQGERFKEKDCWAYNIATVSSYSEMLEQAYPGNDGERDCFPRLNLALIFGEKTGLPFCYRRLSEIFPDVSTVKHLLADSDLSGVSKIKLVTEASEEETIRNLYHEHLKFLIGTETSFPFVKKELERVFDNIRIFTNYKSNLGVYAYTVKTEWCGSDTNKKRIFVHLYYSINKEAEDEKKLRALLETLQAELTSGNRQEAHERQYRKYFDIIETPGQVIQISAREEAVREERRYCGYFSLVTNEFGDAQTALRVYRNKALLESVFGNLKDRFNMRRIRGGLEQNLEGKIFVEFIALIYLSYITGRMQEQELDKEFTVQQVLDKLDVIESFEYPGHELRIGEMNEKQKELYTKLGVEPPVSM